MKNTCRILIAALCGLALLGVASCSKDVVREPDAPSPDVVKEPDSPPGPTDGKGVLGKYLGEAVVDLKFDLSSLPAALQDKLKDKLPPPQTGAMHPVVREGGEPGVVLVDWSDGYGHDFTTRLRLAKSVEHGKLFEVEDTGVKITTKQVISGYELDIVAESKEGVKEFSLAEGQGRTPQYAAVYIEADRTLRISLALEGTVSSSQTLIPLKVPFVGTLRATAQREE